MEEQMYVPARCQTFYDHMRVQIRSDDPHGYPSFGHFLQDIEKFPEIWSAWNNLNWNIDDIYRELQGQPRQDINKVISDYIHGSLKVLWQPLYQMYLNNPYLLTRYPSQIDVTDRHPCFETWVSVIYGARHALRKRYTPLNSPFD